MGENIPKHFCKSCGKEITKEDTICPHCGSDLKKVGRHIEVALSGEAVITSELKRQLTVKQLSFLEKLKRRIVKWRKQYQIEDFEISVTFPPSVTVKVKWKKIPTTNKPE